jgi:hypothetical protein
MTFNSKEQYHEFWRPHPALGPYWSDIIVAYLDADLVGAATELRPAANPECVAQDLRDLYAPERDDAQRALQNPAIALRAPRGILDQPDAAVYPAGYLQEVAATQPLLRVREVEDVNHYTILLDAKGAVQVADAVRELGRG